MRLPKSRHLCVLYTFQLENKPQPKVKMNRNTLQTLGNILLNNKGWHLKVG